MNRRSSTPLEEPLEPECGGCKRGEVKLLPASILLLWCCEDALGEGGLALLVLRKIFDEDSGW